MAPMPISGTGSKRFLNDAGVTLVEAMVALMIVGMVAGAVVLLAPGPDRLTRMEADRLAVRLVMASEDSIVLNRTMALVVTNEGYGFDRLDDAGWVASEPGSPLGFRAWAGGLEGRVEASEAGDDDPHAARFDAMGGASPVSILISGDGGRWRVSINSHGDVNVSRAE